MARRNAGSVVSFYYSAQQGQRPCWAVFFHKDCLLYILYYFYQEIEEPADCQFLYVSHNKAYLEEKKSELILRARKGLEEHKKYLEEMEIYNHTNRKNLEDFLLRHMDAIKEDRRYLSRDMLLGEDKEWHTPDGVPYYPETVHRAKVETIEKLSKYGFLDDCPNLIDMSKINEPLPKRVEKLPNLPLNPLKSPECYFIEEIDEL